MIDWQFIGTLEGRSLTGSVPDPEGSKSGVTIATGCDLGWITPQALAAIPAPLSSRLRPYVGLRGQAAVAALRTSPLAIAPCDADTIDRVTFGEDMAAISTAYAHDAGTTIAFIALPDRAQTVIASLGFQYGNLRRKCPRFWNCAVQHDWPAMIGELRNFGDAYPTRRNREADYLAPLVAGT